MKISLKTEEFAMLLLGIYGFSLLDYAWWWFPLLILAPDIGAIGYFLGNKTGAFTYNLFHHRGVAILVYLTGIFLHQEIIQLIGILIFSHAAMDRIFGYGLKYNKGFQFTHLGKINALKDSKN